MKLLLVSSQNPAYNLAMEEYLLKNSHDDIFMLWQNDNTIVVGRNQNTLSEINMDYIAAHGIHVVRRMSGGGAVYHDLGNVNYSFALNNTKNTYFDFATFTEPVIAFLRGRGVFANLSGRNDLEIDGKKFSGNAQYAYHERILHHGTLMICSDVSVMGKALNVSQQKIESRGIASVKSRVANLCDYMKEPISAREFMEEFAAFMQKQDPTLERYELSEEERSGIQTLYEEKYNTWEWNFGYSPKYTYQNSKKFPSGLIEVQLRVEDGIILEAKFYGDFFSKEDVAEVEKLLCGVKHEKESLEKVLSGLCVEDYFHGISKSDLVSLLL